MGKGKIMDDTEIRISGIEALNKALALGPTAALEYSANMCCHEVTVSMDAEVV